MYYTPNTLFLDSSVPEVDLSVGVFIAYEDLAAGKRAKETCNVLAENLGDDWSIQTQVASLKSLSVPRLRRIAAVEASKANIIVVSCHDGLLPSGVKQWMRMVVSRGVGPMALVALFSCARVESRHAPTAEAYFSDAASQGRMQYFSRYDSKPSQRWDWSERFAADLGQLGRRMSL